LSLIALVLGAINSAFLIYRYVSENRARVEVQCGCMTDPKFSHLTRLYLDAYNHGKNVVYLDYGELTFSGGESYPMTLGTTEFKFPHKLLPHTRFTTWVDIEELVGLLRQKGYTGKVMMGGSFSDQLDHAYRSERIEFDIEFWSELARGESEMTREESINDMFGLKLLDD
jgi:hypothetical protein